MRGLSATGGADLVPLSVPSRLRRLSNPLELPDSDGCGNAPREGDRLDRSWLKRELRLERSEPKLAPGVGDEKLCPRGREVPPAGGCGLVGLGALGAKLGAGAAGGLTEGRDGAGVNRLPMDGPADGLDGIAGAGLAGLIEGLGRLGLIEGAGATEGPGDGLCMPDKRLELPKDGELAGGAGLLRAAEIRSAREEPNADLSRPSARPPVKGAISTDAITTMTAARDLVNLFVNIVLLLPFSSTGTPERKRPYA